VVGGGVGRAYLFTSPVGVIEARRSEEVEAALARIDEATCSGLFAAGYISYDAGLVTDKPIESRHTPEVPLIWLGLYSERLDLDSETLDVGEPGSVADLTPARLNISAENYLQSVSRIKDYIAAGDIYQANFTAKLLFTNSGSARGLFARLRAAHPVGYSAFVNTGEAQIISTSPELFLAREGESILARPMKGTSRRGRWAGEDRRRATRLRSDEKNRAENVMIVDLMRNDIGRVCEMGSVGVPRLFHVERYDTLFQMTSDVTGTLRRGISTADVLKATLPPGSVTGAPKIRACEIIDALESDSRGVYCGAIGMFEPGGDFLLNVAIRTIVQRGAACEMGVGSGIVADSDPEAELRETLLKGKFLLSEPTEFDLLETLACLPSDGFKWLDEHLDRMRESADYFGRRFPERDIRTALDAVREEIETSSRPARVRLLVSKDGSVRVETSELIATPPRPVSLLLSSRPMDPENVFVYHKTTRRQDYDSGHRAAAARGFFDAIYINTSGELTEGAITNVFAVIDGAWVTPPLESGLLPGVWRAAMIAELGASERVIRLDDLARATRVIVGNSVRGSVEVGEIVSDSNPTPSSSAAERPGPLWP